MLNLFLWVQFYKTRNFTDSGNTSISYFSHNRFLKSEKDWTEAEIIKRIHRENLSFKGASREYGISDRTLRDWERIYLEEGEEALLVERRGRACAASGTQKGRKPKLDKQVEEDLIAENQRLRMEIDYLKKLRALVLEEERQNRKHK